MFDESEELTVHDTPSAVNLCMLNVGIFYCWIVILNEHFLEKLDGQGAFPHTPVPYNH